MSSLIKSQAEILAKLHIHQLNPMQEEALKIIPNTANTVLLSPTGTGKTIAFLLPIIALLNPEIVAIQALILVPSRELALQIEQVARQMGSGYKINAVYGGRAARKDREENKVPPAILIGTPGRVADHLRQERFDVTRIKTLVLDEFDKSLEVGFEKEMREIITALPTIKKRILTSATQNIEIPQFVGAIHPTRIDYVTNNTSSKLALQVVTTPNKDKLETLLQLLHHLGNAPGIIFCNFKDTIQFVSDYLYENSIDHGVFYGGMEQRAREESLLMFRNGTIDLLIATDLAARGIDIPEMKFIIHYQLPHSEAEFTHRNGRTARVNAKGTAYVLKWKEEVLRDFMPTLEEATISSTSKRKPAFWETLFITGGRKDKISKGDIAGLFFKQGGISKDQLGVIELKQNCAYVSVPVSIAASLSEKLTNSRLKKKKVRIYILD